MIYFVVNSLHQRTLLYYLTGWGRPIEKRTRVLWHEEIARRRRIPFGTYIFTDLERLTPTELDRAAYCARAVEAAGGRVVNDPAYALRRYDLLRRLHRAGINDFDVYRLDDDPEPRRYPVFIRKELDHDGPETGLIDGRAALESAIERLARTGKGRAGRLVVEYCAAPAADGLFRKYGAFIVGGEVIPRHIQFGREWMVKGQTRVFTDELVAEEVSYVDLNPHAARIVEISRIARIDFGRIDYTVVDDRLQVFEINTNPSLVPPGPSKISARTAIKRSVNERLLAALGALDTQRSRGAVDVGPGGPGFAVSAAAWGLRVSKRGFLARLRGERRQRDV